MLGATAAANDATPKNETPSAKILRSPNRSPSEPPTRISEPSVNRYPLTTHCCAASPPPSARWIVGSATFTTVPSSITIPEPRMHAISVRRLVRASSSVDAGATDASLGQGVSLACRVRAPQRGAVHLLDLGAAAERERQVQIGEQ